MDTASLTGRVAGPLGKGVHGAWIELVDTDRNTRLRTLTNDAGLYIFPSVRPGHYRMQVSALGYKAVELKSFFIYTRADIQQNFALVPGGPEDSVILTSNGAPIQTNGAVSTVVEQQLVNELPLNGRSFQTLFQLVPGVTIAPTTFASQGQISVNGQRTDTNYFVVDGVSANFAIAGGVSPGQTAGGWLPALTVFGGTNSLVSTEAVQEFAVLTSSYSAEFGRVPGAQISIVTRSGTNKLRGNVFEYLRNDTMDANDWFANNKGLKRAALRQNDFGGVLGGPITKDKTFFFASFEALQLRQPTSSSTAVPSLIVRNSAPAPVKPFLDAYPLPNGADQGNGLAQATYGFSNPSSLEALSLRVDHHFRESLSTFVRFAYSVSDGRQRAAGSNTPSTITDTGFGLKTLTGGITYSLSPRILNDFRLNWSQSSADSKEELDSFGGAIPLGQQLVFPPGFSAQTSLFQFSPAVAQQIPGLQIGQNVNNAQSQINVVDDLSYQVRNHLIKAGFDFRRLLPRVVAASYEQQSFFPDIQSALANTNLTTELAASVPVHATFASYGTFAEDTWKCTSRLSATLGLRWDFAAAPAIRGQNGLQPFAVTGFNNLPELSLTPQSRPLYRTPHANFAPRIGFAYQLGSLTKWESVIRGGAGVYYDLSTGPAGVALSAFSFPFAAEAFLSNNSFPLSPRAASPPPITTAPPFSPIQAFSQTLRTPYSYQWNLSFDQILGTAQVFSVSYVGATGHRLLRTEEYVGGVAGVPTQFTQLLLTSNAGYSSFNSLQAKLEKRAGQAHLIAAYTLAHSLDNVSTDADFNGIPSQFVNPRRDYGPSDFDIRQFASIGLDYTPAKRMPSFFRSLFSGWSLDPIMLWRSSPPVTPVVRNFGFGGYDFRPDLVNGVPLYLYDPRFPGGRRLNPAALSVPTVLRQGDLGRNFFRGFPLFQTDLAIHRSFRLERRMRLQVRIEGFNITNHPNFALPTTQLGVISPNGKFMPQPGFGYSPSSLSQGLQGGTSGSGFSPLYQIGGARSLQLAFKLEY